MLAVTQQDLDEHRPTRHLANGFQDLGQPQPSLNAVRTDGPERKGKSDTC